MSPCRVLPAAMMLAILVLSVHSAVSQTAAQSQTPTPTAKPRPGPACTPLAEITATPAPTPDQSQPAPVPLNLDVCVKAHVFDVVELLDGTRFLDVCPPDLPDDQCRFAVVSLTVDRGEVGDLRRYRDQDIQLRGTLRRMHGRLGIVVSHARQFGGGPEKFKPNPRLLHGFNAQSDQAPIRDPNLAPAGHHRSFMNTQDKEALPRR
jgi:hypothetical protein